MHRGTLIGTLAVAAAAIACGGPRPAVTTVTSGSWIGEPELSRSLSAVSERMAFQLCLHESNCGRPQSQACVEEHTAKARDEIMSWNCEPASIRARAEECLAALREESCSAELMTRRRLCGVNDACPNRTADLIAPGPALADVMAR